MNFILENVSLKPYTNLHTAFSKTHTIQIHTIHDFL